MERAILIVEDEPQLLRLLVRVLEKAGWKVLTAEDGEAAVALVDTHTVEIAAAVVDVGIPPGGAGEVIERLALVAPAAGLVMASGDQLMGPLRARVDALGGVFLRKPFLPDALVSAVASVTGSESS